MIQSIQGYLGSLQIGEIQQFKNLTMVPVASDYDDGLGYITLGEALGVGSIEIREVSESGSVLEPDPFDLPDPSRLTSASIRSALSA